MTLRTHRLYWILLLSLILAAGPGIARTVAQGAVSGRSGITTANPHAALPETITAPEQRKIARGLHIQADDETPEPTDEAGTPADDDTAVSSDAATTFEDYLGQTDSLESAFGPEEGTLEHDPEAVSFVQAGVDLPNF